MVRIDISAMSDGIHEVVANPSPEELELDPEKFDDIEARVRLDIGDHQILAELHISARAELICDRTLVPFQETVHGDFTVVFSKKAVGETAPDESMRPLDPATHELDLGDEMRDTLLLSMPLRKVAPDAQDADLVLRYGEHANDSNVDPRWKALEALKQSPSPPEVAPTGTDDRKS